MLDFTTQRPQLMMLAGIVMLGWVLVRRQIKTRRRLSREQRHHDRAVRDRGRQDTRRVPLSGAPVETLRWQGEMFDLQRELKAELETKIAVVQSLLRQVDQRIDRLESHAESVDPLTADQAEQVRRLNAAGETAQAIAARLELPLGDVEWQLAITRGTP